MVGMNTKQKSFIHLFTSLFSLPTCFSHERGKTDRCKPYGSVTYASVAALIAINISLAVFFGLLFWFLVRDKNEQINKCQLV